MMRRILAATIVLTAAVAHALLVRIEWNPPTEPGVVNQQPDPVTGYQLYRCDGPACSPETAGGPAWQAVQTYPAPAACTTSPCTGTYEINLQPNAQVTASFYLTALTATQTSLPSNVITRGFVNSPDRPPGPPETLRFAWSLDGTRVVDVRVHGSGRVLLAKHEPLINAGDLVVLRVVEDSRRIRVR